MPPYENSTATPFSQRRPKPPYLPKKNASGEIDGIFVHATDVTDMVTARQTIEQSEIQFQTPAESIPHLAWMADEASMIPRRYPPF
jgi:hypothetical protein